MAKRNNRQIKLSIRCNNCKLKEHPLCSFCNKKNNYKLYQPQETVTKP